MFVAHEVNNTGQTVVKYLKRSFDVSPTAETVTHHDLLVELTTSDEIAEVQTPDNQFEIQLEFTANEENLSNNLQSKVLEAYLHNLEDEETRLTYILEGSRSFTFVLPSKSKSESFRQENEVFKLVPKKSTPYTEHNSDNL